MSMLRIVDSRGDATALNADEITSVRDEKLDGGGGYACHISMKNKTAHTFRNLVRTADVLKALNFTVVEVSPGA